MFYDHNKLHLTFPILNVKSLNQEDNERLHQKLYSDSFEIMCKFQDLFSASVESFQDNKVPLEEILLSSRIQGSAEPARHNLNLPILFTDFRSIEDTEQLMWEVKSCCSFFNFHMLERIIDRLGTDKDRANFTRYKEDFSKYAERDVLMCPSEYGTMKEEGHANLFITLDSSYNNCTLSRLQQFNIYLRNLFNTELQLCHLFSENGMLKLMFQIPLSVQQTIFPFSSEQEGLLCNLGVSQLSCGDYLVDLNEEHVSCFYLHACRF